MRVFEERVRSLLLVDYFMMLCLVLLDFMWVMKTLKQAMWDELGPYAKRPSAIKATAPNVSIELIGVCSL